MQKRAFGKCDVNSSLLGLGCMRFPTKGEGDDTKVDEEKAIELIRHCIDSGVNYIDTAYPYHGGESEPIVGKALKDGYREKIYLATKSPVWKVEKYEDFEKYLDEQLEKLQTDCIDFYLLHALDKERWDKAKELGALKFLDEAISKGKIKHACFSFHDNLEVFKEIVDAYPWSMCLIQLNYLDEDYQAGVKGLKYAHEKGLAVAIMEPLRGGKLAKDIPADIQKVWDKYKEKRTPAEWAFRWLANFPEVSVILSGMGTKEEVNENISILDSAKPNCLSEEELSLIDEAKTIYIDRMKIACTECNYCVPCPQEVMIPTLFSVYNSGYMFENHKGSKETYARIKKMEKDASKCVECSLCEKECPQNLPIIEHLKKIEKELG
ncbi:aldo/keto reductase [Proteinivorax hydrogeniformans]|uniref:Aldo/keto reductase n=1 Tax=Proteinivorax hydrogeniformans TaxID=1826727 RepID=A0AAU8HTK5_9FIRM